MSNPSSPCYLRITRPCCLGRGFGRIKYMNKALFVIDVQGFFENKGTKLVARKINNYIKKNKSKYSFIIFTVFKNNSTSSLQKIFKWNGCSKGKDIKIIKELSESVSKNKIVFRKTYSLYKVPQIQNKLKKHKIEQVDICGFDTDCCILAATYDLFDSGYRPVILKSLCFSTSKEKLHKPALKIIERNCGFLSK